MQRTSKIYRLLRPVRDAVVDLAMAEALPTAARSDRRLIVLSLLERRHEAGLVGLVRHYHLLDEGLQQLVLEHMALLDGALRTAAQGGGTDGRANAVRIIVAARGFRLSYLITAQLHHDDPHLIREAAAGLLTLAEALGGGESGAGWPTGQAHQGLAQRVSWLGAAIAEAAAAYPKHGRREVLLAAAALAPRRIPRLLTQLADASRRAGAAHAGLRDLIRQAEHPAILSGMLFFAGLEPLRSAVTEALASAGAGRHMGLMLRDAHLLAVAAARSAVRRIKAVDHLLPGEELLGELPVRQRRAAARWIGALAVDSERRVEALVCLAGDDDPLARLLALRGLIAAAEAETGPGADAAIGSMCFDGEPAIARIALRHLLRRRWPGLARVAVRLVASPHASVRRLAERHLTPAGFEGLWEHWDELDAERRASAGRALMKIDPEFPRQLAGRMSDPDGAARFKAVMMVRMLGQEAAVREQLLERAGDGDPRVASAAVAALGSSGEADGAAERLAEALGHEDDRVRANAVEAIERIGCVGEAGDRLREVASGRGARSRANALKALLELPAAGAMEALRAMLADPEPEHRTSALWVAERLGLAPVARRIAELARGDGDRQVRRRAARVIRRMAEAAETGQGAEAAGAGGAAGGPRAEAPSTKRAGAAEGSDSTCSSEGS